MFGLWPMNWLIIWELMRLKHVVSQVILNEVIFPVMTALTCKGEDTRYEYADER